MIWKPKAWLLPCLGLALLACDPGPEPSGEEPKEEEPQTTFYYGADLSYVNELEDCGASYKNTSGTATDPYALFAKAGANLVRVRLWHTPDWTNYSNYSDVQKTIRRAKAEGMQVLLDLHYSDTWADPNKQEIPAAWLPVIDNTPTLADSVYNYTHKVLSHLATEGLLPELVQVGNEINGMILQQGELAWPIDWTRNRTLLEAGIQAVRDVAGEQNVEIGVMLHIAQPENALWWFEQATEAGLTNYDWIGLSYYPVWSEYNLASVGSAIRTLITSYNKRLMVVETAYPFTMENVDPANNILGNEALIAGYPATQQGQLNYLTQLQSEIAQAGGEGLIYWEPAWVSTGCSTLWGQGSHWDNATLFDHAGVPTLGMQFYAGSKDEE